MSKPQTIWNNIASWWDKESENGDPFHTYLIHPFLETSLRLTAGEKMLDLGCGTGFLSRFYASKGITVVAADFSSKMLEIAKSKTAPELPVSYLQLDLCDSSSLGILRDMEFDAALCSMALHNLQTLHPLIETLSKVLAPSGKFVFSIPHPCLNSTPGLSIVREDDLYPPDIVTTHSVRLKDYLSRQEFLLTAKEGQPMPHFNVHRSLQDLLAVCFDNGFRMTGLIEPSGKLIPEELDSMWHHLPEIPPAMIVTLELASGQSA